MQEDELLFIVCSAVRPRGAVLRRPEPVVRRAAFGCGSYCEGVSATPEEIKAGTAGGFGRAASTYDTVIPFFETFARDLVEAAAPQPGDRVLDVACGRGACLRVAAQHVGRSGYVLGADLSSDMIDMARQDLVGLDLPASVEVRVADAEHLDVPDDSFDVVVCGFGVFFFPDAAAAMSEFGRVSSASFRCLCLSRAGRRRVG